MDGGVIKYEDNTFL